MGFADIVKNADGLLAAPLAGFPAISLTNSTVKDNLTNGQMQAKSLIAMHSKVNFDVIFPMMDLTVESEALGAQVDWETDEMPCIKGISVVTLEDAEAIKVPEVGEGNRLNVFVESCRSLREAFPNKTIWAYALGPFSMAGRLMGMTDISIAVKLEPETVHATLEKCNELLKKYITALLDTGVDGLMILEPASSLLREDDANEFSNSYISELVELIKSRGKTPALHNCGNIGHLIESLCATGIEALSVGSVTDPAEVYPRIPESVVLFGNLDPTEVFLRSSAEDVYAAAAKLSDRMADCERFIISSGCDLPPGVPVGNLIAFESAARGKELVHA